MHVVVNTYVVRGLPTACNSKHLTALENVGTGILYPKWWRLAIPCPTWRRHYMIHIYNDNLRPPFPPPPPPFYKKTTSKDKKHPYTLIGVMLILCSNSSCHRARTVGEVARQKKTTTHTHTLLLQLKDTRSRLMEE